MSKIFTVVDADGTVLARMTREVADRMAPGFLPATGNRLVHPALVAASRAAQLAVNAQAAEDFWADVAAMSEPAGIRSSLA